MVRRTLPGAATAVALIVIATRVLGAPNPGLAAAFFRDGVPTLEEGEAVVALLSWALILVVAGCSVGGSLRALGSSEMVRDRSRRSLLVMIAGVALFVAALVQREVPQPSSLCCGSDAAAIQQAASLAR